MGYVCQCPQDSIKDMGPTDAQSHCLTLPGLTSLKEIVKGIVQKPLKQWQAGELIISSTACSNAQPPSQHRNASWHQIYCTSTAKGHTFHRRVGYEPECSVLHQSYSAPPSSSSSSPSSSSADSDSCTCITPRLLGSSKGPGDSLAICLKHYSGGLKVQIKKEKQRNGDFEMFLSSTTGSGCWGAGLEPASTQPRVTF